MIPFHVAKYYGQCLDPRSDVNLTFLPITNGNVQIPSNTHVPVHVRFLSGADAATIQNLTSADSVIVTIKSSASPANTTILAQVTITADPSGDYHSGTMRTDGSELLAAIANSTSARGISVEAFAFVTYAVGGSDPVTTLPVSVQLINTAYNASGDTGPSLP